MTENSMYEALEKVMEKQILQFLDSKKGQAMLEQYMLQFMKKKLSEYSNEDVVLNEEKQKTSATLEEFLTASEKEVAIFEGNSENNANYYEYRPRAMESRLRQHGYSVAQNSGMTNYQRQQLLRELIEEKEFTKGEILAHLKYLLKINGESKKNEMAAIKWRMDMEFVRKL